VVGFEEERSREVDGGSAIRDKILMKFDGNFVSLKPELLTKEIEYTNPIVSKKSAEYSAHT
jgi:hypothetical protein